MLGLGGVSLRSASDHVSVGVFPSAHLAQPDAAAEVWFGDYVVEINEAASPVDDFVIGIVLEESMKQVGLVPGAVFAKPVVVIFERPRDVVKMNDDAWFEPRQKLKKMRSTSLPSFAT